jgi:guanylate kinase
MFTVITLSGPSASGKSVVKTSLGVLHITTATTRKPRKNEIDGKDYHFMTHRKFWTMYHNGEILEKNFFEGNYYGMYRETLEQVKSSDSVYAVVCEANGVDFLTQYFGKQHILPIFLTLPIESIERRLRERNLPDNDFLKRYERAKYELSSEYLSRWEREGHVLFNGDSVPLSATVGKVQELVHLHQSGIRASFE